MVRERHVGRRLWRRRKRRTEPAVDGEKQKALPPSPGLVGPADHDDDEFEDDELDVAPFASPPAPPAQVTVATAKKPGFFARLFGKKEPPAPPPPPPDPLAPIMAVPRGAARLDAFEQRLRACAPGSHEAHVIAVAFFDELVTLADDAGVELSLMESRVTACADALVACGEDERAGGLYVRLGRRHQAAESFVKAGAIEALEEAHAELAFAEGGRRLEARLAFERFEALFLVGRRIEALTSLERAVQQSMQHPVYVEVLNGFRARLPAAGGVVLTAGDDVVRVLSRFPLVLGRGEDSAVRIDSPLVSRAHVDIQRRAGELVVNDLVSSGGTRIDDVVIAGPTPLSARGCIDLAGVQIDYDVDDARLLLRPRLRARLVTLAARTPHLNDPALGMALHLDNGRVVLVADGRARINNEAPRIDQLLLVGDRLVVAGRTWLVSG